MSYTYYLVCLDTGEALSLGSLGVNAYTPLPEYSIGNFGYNVKREADRPAVDLMVHAVINFLLRHRGRDVRLLPETVTGPYESDHFPSNGIDTMIPTEPEEYAKLFSLPIGEPNAESDPQFMPEKLWERLEELKRGENIEKLPWDEVKG